jgi:lipid-binding SYLF domain-containing protein
MRTTTLLCCLLLPAAFAGEAENKRLQAAAEVFGEIMGAGDQSIPLSLLNKSQCAIIVPSAKKAGFIFGAKYGRGWATCRPESGNGWSAPAGMRLEGGSFGLQIGVAETDIILLVMSKEGMDRLLKSQFTLGGEATAAAGPVGRDTQASTDVTLRAEILAWSRSRGVFGGLALQGSTMREDKDADIGLYGSSQDRSTLLHGKTQSPAAASALVSVLTKYSPKATK